MSRPPPPPALQRLEAKDDAWLVEAARHGTRRQRRAAQAELRRRLRKEPDPFDA